MQPETPATSSQPAAGTSPGSTGVWFGDYELLGEIARGGMGVVYRARQSSLNRIVALKMVLGGHLASAEDIQRFRAEAEAAASLRHPGIIAIHEVGEIQGQHFFSMDFVDGQSLAAAARHHPWSPEEAARVVRTIAEAIHYAHAQGVLHRDLKPSNVLLDAGGQPHVTDFGLARRIAAGPDLTLPGQVLGTPSYMSPEQAAAASPETLGPATDVYSLGAILYELVTGRPPFAAATPHETLHQLLTTDPVAPRQLNPAVPADLETIALKCLEKDPVRRYGTALALAEDLGRYLRLEPIQAMPPSTIYRARKFARRHRLGVTVAAVVAFVLLSATAVSILFGVQADRDRRAALKAQSEARAREEDANAVLNFFEIAVLSAGRPAGRDNGLGINTTIGMAVESAAQRVGEQFASRPAIAADIRDVLGSTYYSLGDFPHAIEQLELARVLREKHLGPDHPDTLQTLNNLGLALMSSGRHTEATNFLMQVAGRAERVYGTNVQKTLSAFDNLASAYVHLERFDLALPLQEEVVRRSNAFLGGSRQNSLAAISNLAETYAKLGQLDKCIALLEPALAQAQAMRDPSSEALATLQNNLAIQYARQGQHTNALAMLEKLLRSQQSLLPSNHPALINTRYNLASLRKETGDLEGALEQFQTALSLSATNLSTQRGRTIVRGLGSVLRRMGRTNEALAMLGDAVSVLRRSPTPRPRELSSALNDLGVAHLSAGQWSNAIPILKEAMAMGQAAGPDEDREMTTVMENLAAAYRKAGLAADAASLLNQALQRRTNEVKRGFDRQSPSASTERDNQTAASARLKRIADLQENLRQRLLTDPAGSSGVVDAQCRLMQAYFEDAQADRGNDILRQILASEAAWSRRSLSNVTVTLDATARLVMGQGLDSVAENIFRANLRLLEKAQPNRSPMFVAQAMVGVTLFRQKRYSEAEPFLTNAYAGLKLREAQSGGVDPARSKITANLAEGLTELYTATGDKTQAAVWRARMAGAPTSPAR